MTLARSREASRRILIAHLRYGVLCGASLVSGADLVRSALPLPQVPGPDLVVSQLNSVASFGNLGGIGAYAFGVTVCNVGDQPAPWVAGTNQHPVYAAALYRHAEGRFEQIGTSWALHEFGALASGGCGTCIPPGTSSLLGVGCATSHSANVAGSQGLLGARADIDPVTGAFSMPYTGMGQVGGTLDKRLQVALVDLDVTLHPSANYLGEAQYLSAADAAAGYGDNNCSYRTVLRGGGPTPSLVFAGATTAGQPAIAAWPQLEAGVLMSVSRDDGAFWVGSTAMDNGNGTWRYEYAVYNQNSSRGAGSFAVPLPDGATVTNAAFHDIEHHSGSVWDGADWTLSVVPGAVSWATTPFGLNPNANAIRWGTLYNFRFDCDAAPEQAALALGLFGPGAVAGLAPLGVVPGPSAAVGVVLCAPNGQHSGGTWGRLALEGSTVVAANQLGLVAFDLPRHVFGFLNVSAMTGFTPGAGGAQGDLCLGGTIGRFVGAVGNAGALGRFVTDVNLGGLPSPVSQAVTPGATWVFQAWFRDSNPAATSNFTNALSLTFL